MIQKLIEKLNKKRLKERISSAIVMVALIVSISGVVGAVSGIVVSNRYNYALKNYGLPKYISNFPYFTGFPACALAKRYVFSLIFALMR